MTIYESIIEHPLFKRYEYAMEDGSYGVKNVVLNEAVFFIRTDYDPKMKYLMIFEKILSSLEKEIVKFELEI